MINGIEIIQLTQQFDFSDDSLCIDQVFEGLWYFLDGDFCFDRVIDRGADDAVGAVTYLLDVFVLVLHQELCACISILKLECELIALVCLFGAVLSLRLHSVIMHLHVG